MKNLSEYAQFQGLRKLFWVVYLVFYRASLGDGMLYSSGNCYTTLVEYLPNFHKALDVIPSAT